MSNHLRDLKRLNLKELYLDNLGFLDACTKLVTLELELEQFHVVHLRNHLAKLKNLKSIYLLARYQLGRFVDQLLPQLANLEHLTLDGVDAPPIDSLLESLPGLVSLCLSYPVGNDEFNHALEILSAHPLKVLKIRDCSQFTHLEVPLAKASNIKEIEFYQLRLDPEQLQMLLGYFPSVLEVLIGGNNNNHVSQLLIDRVLGVHDQDGLLQDLLTNCKKLTLANCQLAGTYYKLSAPTVAVESQDPHIFEQSGVPAIYHADADDEDPNVALAILP